MINRIFQLFVCLPVFVGAQSIVTGDSLAAGVTYKNITDYTLAVSPQGTNTADFDLDQDNVQDIRFSIKQTYSPGSTWELHQVFSLNNIEVAALNTPAGFADSMALNSTISATLNWSAAGAGINLFEYFYTGGNATVTGVYMQPNNYLAFRKKMHTDTLYGWILLDNDLTNGMVIRSWAYKSKTVGVQRLEQGGDVLSVYPNPAPDKVTVDSKGRSITEFRLINVLGEVVMRQTGLESQKLSLDLKGLDQGIYFLELSLDDRIITKRIIKR